MYKKWIYSIYFENLLFSVCFTLKDIHKSKIMWGWHSRIIYQKENFFCNIPTWTVQLLMLYSISTCTINNAVMSGFATNYFKIQWRIQFLQWYIKLFMHYICSLNINKINDNWYFIHVVKKITRIYYNRLKCSLESIWHLWTWVFGINSQNYYSFLKEILVMIFKYIESR